MFSFLLNNVNLILLIVIYIQSVLKLCFLEFESTPNTMHLAEILHKITICIQPQWSCFVPYKWSKINGFHWVYFAPLINGVSSLHFITGFSGPTLQYAILFQQVWLINGGDPN